MPQGPITYEPELITREYEVTLHLTIHTTEGNDTYAHTDLENLIEDGIIQAHIQNTYAWDDVESEVIDITLL